MLSRGNIAGWKNGLKYKAGYCWRNGVAPQAGEHPFKSDPMEWFMLLGVIPTKVRFRYTLPLSSPQDGKQIIDVTPFIDSGRSSELRNQNVSDSVRIELGTIYWPGNPVLDRELLSKESIALVSTAYEQIKEQPLSVHEPTSLRRLS